MIFEMYEIATVCFLIFKKAILKPHPSFWVPLASRPALPHQLTANQNKRPQGKNNGGDVPGVLAGFLLVYFDHVYKKTCKKLVDIW